MRCFSRLPCNNQNTTRLCRIYEIYLCFYDCLFLSLIKHMRGEGRDMPYILEGSGDTMFVAEYMKNMCPCPCFSLLLFGMKFITGFGCHQTKEISHCLFSSVSFLVVANVCTEDVKHSRAAGVGTVVLFFRRYALLQTRMARVLPNPVCTTSSVLKSVVVGGHQPPQN